MGGGQERPADKVTLQQRSIRGGELCRYKEKNVLGRGKSGALGQHGAWYALLVKGKP